MESKEKGASNVKYQFRNRDMMHRCYGGEIFEDDFGGRLTMCDVAGRIMNDRRVDKESVVREKDMGKASGAEICCGYNPIDITDELWQEVFEEARKCIKLDEDYIFSLLNENQMRRTGELDSLSITLLEGGKVFLKKDYKAFYLLSLFPDRLKSKCEGECFVLWME